MGKIIVKTKLNNNTERKNFKTIVINFRNSIHNNGTYISRKGASNGIPWNDDTYIFNHGQRIEKPDLWIHYIKFSHEFIKIFIDIINLNIIQKESYIEDITEPK